MPEEHIDAGDIHVIIPTEAKEPAEVEDGFDLDPRSKSIAKKWAQGWTQVRIAEAHETSSKTVWRTLQREEVEEYVEFLLDERYSDPSTDRILDLTDRAVDRLAELVESKSDSVALRAVVEVLRSGSALRNQRALERRFTMLVHEIEPGWMHYDQQIQ